MGLATGGMTLDHHSAHAKRHGIARRPSEHTLWTAALIAARSLPPLASASRLRLKSSRPWKVHTNKPAGEDGKVEQRRRQGARYSWRDGDGGRAWGAVASLRRTSGESACAMLPDGEVVICAGFCVF